MTDSNKSRLLVIGTSNPGKLREIKAILGELSWELRSLKDFSKVGVPSETGQTYAENALAKARHYAAATGQLALADDSGLEVRALGGAPGLFSARYAGDGASDSDRRALLLSELAGVPRSERRARFVCVAAIASPDHELEYLAEGTCDGVIGEQPKGHGGFGFDPLFVPEGYEQAFAEIAESVKNQISHRAQALIKIRDFLIKAA